MKIRGLVQTVRGYVGKAIAGPDTDPQRHFFGNLMFLPNPDPILRELGTAERTYHAILADAHVMGEVRSIRGSFRAHEYRVVTGEEGNAKSEAARLMCEQWMRSQKPNAINDWLEVMWQMCASILTGYRAHELVWNYADGMLLPQVVDRPGRRFRFDADGKPLLVSVDNLMGAPVEPHQFVISRNMPTYENPYGMALLSSCYWPWIFKTGGWRYFVKYCERHGLPWPVGRYPQGTDEAEQDKLAQALAEMHENGYVVAQEGTSLELLSPTPGGSVPQQQLITLANREMSKALTSQSMVGEQLEVGSRAASETAKDRQDSVHDSDRDIAASSMSEVFGWITRFNLGDDVAPPRLEFYKHQVAGKERAETYNLVRSMGGKPSRKAMLAELDIPAAEDDADALVPTAKPAVLPVPGQRSQPLAIETVDFSALEGFTFAKAAGMTEAEAIDAAIAAGDSAIEDRMIKPVYEMLVRYEREGKTLHDFQADLVDIVGVMDEEGLREVMERAMSYSILRGAATQAD